MRTIVDNIVKRIGAGRLAGLVGVAALAACAAEDGASDVPGANNVVTVQSGLGTPVQFGTLNQLGMQVIFTEIQNPTNITPSTITGLAACGAKELFVTMPDSLATFGLYFSSDGGLSFAKVRGVRGDGQVFDVAAKSKEIACDDHELLTMDAAKQIYWAGRTGPNISIPGSTGTDPWTASATGPLVDHIQGGDGTIYGVQDSTHTLYKSTTHFNGPYDLINWVSVSQIGSKIVSGGGSTNNPDTLAWPRRAFTTEPDGTSYLNDKILDGNNGWTFFDTGSERFSVLSVGSTTVLYGIDLTNGPRLVTITTKETSCTDGQDNDADGMKDSEDPDCYEAAAVAFCALGSTVNGTYCVDRYEPATFLGQANQNAGLVTCTNHLVVPPTMNGPKVPKVGACVRSGTHSDRLLTQAELAGSDPTGSGRWCNMMWLPNNPNTSLRNKWDFAWGGTDPCQTIRNRNTNSASMVVVRAGLFSTGDENNVLVNCNNGAVIERGTGSTPLQDGFNAVGHTANACIFTVSPSRLAVWTKPYPAGSETGVSHYNHTYSSVELSQFGHGEAGPSIDIDRQGFNGSPDDIREHAYDIFMAEGTPLYALAGGTVVTNGSIDRDVSTFGCPTSWQGELTIKYVNGSNATYQETFSAAYAHGRRRLVVDGQTVRAGQIVGYVGETGCAGGVHVHFGAIRTSNMNAHTTDNPAYGYHMTFTAGTSTGTTLTDRANVDPMGWTNVSAMDPSGYQDRNTDSGLGFLGDAGWSIDLFKAGEHPNL